MERTNGDRLDRASEGRTRQVEKDDRLRRKQVRDWLTSVGERGWYLVEVKDDTSVWKSDICYDLHDLLEILDRPIRMLKAESYRDAHRALQAVEVADGNIDYLLEAASEIEHGSSD